MTPLPERKKTSEELAELRGNLGVPDQLPPDAPGAVRGEPVELPEAKERVPTPADEAGAIEEDPGAAVEEGDQSAGPASPLRSAAPGEAGAPAEVAPRGPKPVRSLKRSERQPFENPPPKREPPPDSKLPPHKPVRSLKRSERQPPKDPPPKREPPPDSKLPVHKHEDDQLQRIRMMNSMQVKPPVGYIASQAAHPALLFLGYLLAIGGGMGGVLVAFFLFWKKPRSTHHAAWMTIIAVLVLAFGTLYLISQTDGP